MNIEEAKELLEADYVANDIRKLPPKDRLAFYVNILEFFQAKLMRGNVLQETEHSDKDITIQIVDTTSDTNLS